MRARISSKIGLIRPQTKELAALECHEKKSHRLTMRKTTSSHYSAANTYFPLYLLLGETGYRVIQVFYREIIF